jgi:hypothetical protein
MEREKLLLVVKGEREFRPRLLLVVPFGNSACKQSVGGPCIARRVHWQRVSMLARGNPLLPLPRFARPHGDNGRPHFSRLCGFPSPCPLRPSLRS